MTEINAQLNIIDTSEKLNKFMQWLKNYKPEYLVLDCETDGLFEKTANLYGIGLCFSEKNAFYIVMRDKFAKEIWQEKEKDFIKWQLIKLAQESKVIGHNIIYDILVIKNNLEIDLTEYVYCDTILLAHTLNEEGPFGLKDLAVKELGDWANKAQQALFDNIKLNGGKITKDCLEMFKADTAVLAEYCMWDVLLTLKLFKQLEPKLKDENLEELFYVREVMPLYKLVTIPMKDNGFPVDVEFYKNLKNEISEKIIELEDNIVTVIEPLVSNFCNDILDDEVPISNSGSYPKKLAEKLGAPIPLAQKKDKATGISTFTPTLSKAAVEKQKQQTPQFATFYDWILGNISIAQAVASGIPLSTFQDVQKEMYLERKGGRHVFNLRSNDHLSYLLFTSLKYKPLETTPTGKPKINGEYFDTIKADNPIISKIIDYKKLNKLLSTYVEGILERQYNGKIYTDMLQFGTTSGRYSSSNPNLQNQPRIKDEDAGLSPLVLHYTNKIRHGFVAPEGYKIVNADYSSLEPVCFAHMSDEEKLRDIFRTGKDLYSQVAIDVNKLEKEYSADKKAPNFLKKHKPELRQLWKVPTLGIVYGMEESRLMEAIGCTYQQAREIINGYLNTYPNLKKYMFNCNYEAKNKGYVKSQFGRIRHLPECKAIHELYGDKILDYKWASGNNPDRMNLTDIRRKYKNYLNNAKNFKIQSIAASIVNMAMIATAKAFDKHNIDGYIGLQVHDEITCIVAEEHAELAKKLLKEAMETTTIISVPLVAEPLIADNWGEAK
jgi:DNA polymerase I-like protein with 3'-5' exonuclease and polymerase domains